MRSSSNLLVKKIWSKKIKEIFLNKNNFRLCLSDEIFHKLSKNNELLLLASSLLESKQIRELYILLDFIILTVLIVLFFFSIRARFDMGYFIYLKKF